MEKIIFIKNFFEFFQKEKLRYRLSLERQNRVQKLFSKKEQERFIAAENITLYFLNKYFNIKNAEIFGKTHEKPYIKDHPDFSFSRSYSDDNLCIAFASDFEVGIDCENIKKADFSIINSFFTENEKEFIKNSKNEDLAFAIIWTRKESYIKCIGKGLNFNWNLLDVTPNNFDESASFYISKNDKIKNHFLNSYLINDTVLSVCSENLIDIAQPIKEGI